MKRRVGGKGKKKEEKERHDMSINFKTELFL